MTQKQLYSLLPKTQLEAYSSLAPEQKELYSLLPIGAENAISMHKLAKLLDVDDRATRKQIYNLRLAGVIVAGDNNGYYIPANTAELRSYYFFAKARGISTLASLKSARKALLQYGIDPEKGGNV